MDHKALADRILALGVGTMYGSEIFYSLVSSEYAQGWEAEQFVHSWEVFGQLAQECLRKSVEIDLSKGTDDLPNSWILMCVRALEDKEKEGKGMDGICTYCGAVRRHCDPLSCRE